MGHGDEREEESHRPLAGKKLSGLLIPSRVRQARIVVHKWIPENLLTPRAQASGLCHQPRLPGQRVVQPPWLRTHDSSVNELFITYLA